MRLASSSCVVALCLPGMALAQIAAVDTPGEVSAVDVDVTNAVYHFVQASPDNGPVRETWSWLMYERDQITAGHTYDSMAVRVRVDCTRRTVQNTWLEVYLDNRLLHGMNMDDPPTSEGRGQQFILAQICDGDGAMRVYQNARNARAAVDYVVANR